MPSQPLETAGWNFSPVFDLMDSDVHDAGSPTLRPVEMRPPAALSGGGVGLGNFWKLYESLGMTNHAAAPPLPPLDESELSNSDDLLPSPVLEVRKMAQSLLVQDAAAIDATPGTTKKQRRKARRLAEKALQEDESTSETQKSSKVNVNPAKKTDVEIVPQTPTKPSRAKSNVGAKIRPSTPTLAPNTVRPPQTPVTQQAGTIFGSTSNPTTPDSARCAPAWPFPVQNGSSARIASILASLQLAVAASSGYYACWLRPSSQNCTTCYCATALTPRHYTTTTASHT
jgi:hypothetical protein